MGITKVRYHRNSSIVETMEERRESTESDGQDEDAMRLMHSMPSYGAWAADGRLLLPHTWAYPRLAPTAPTVPMTQVLSSDTLAYASHILDISLTSCLTRPIFLVFLRDASRLPPSETSPQDDPYTNLTHCAT